MIVAFKKKQHQKKISMLPDGILMLEEKRGKEVD